MWISPPVVITGRAAGVERRGVVTRWRAVKRVWPMVKSLGPADLAYLDAENGTFDMNNVGTGASCDPENDPSFCDLREMNGYEYGIVLEVINHLPPDIKSWAIEVFMNGRVQMWDSQITYWNPATQRSETMYTDYHKDTNTIHIWSGNLRRSFIQILTSWCHESVHALTDKHHTNEGNTAADADFQNAVGACRQASIPFN